MKRDWDLLREQLLAIEEDDFKKKILGAVGEPPIWLDEQSDGEYGALYQTHVELEQRVFGHLEMLVDNGFIEGLQLSRSGESFAFSIFHPRLTMAGHDLLDTMRSKTLWNKVKSTAQAKGIELTFDSIKALAALALKSVLGS